MRWARKKGGADPLLAGAFPAALEGPVGAAIEAMPPAALGPARRTAVSVRGEDLVIPYRIYNPEPDHAALAALSPTQRQILRCLYTRHHDGFVRERAVRALLGTSLEWVIPFVVQLVGEYVVEIVEAIHDGLAETTDLEPYRTFASENPAFVLLTKQRAVSYWNCYYRSRYGRFADYPGRAALDLILGVGSGLH